MNKIISLLAFMALFAGCQKDASNIVLVRVNDRAITAEDVKVAVLLRAKLYELGGRMPKDLPFNAWANRTGAQLFSSLINTQLMSSEIAAKNVEPEAVDWASVLADYNRVTGQTAPTIEALSKMMDDRREDFLKVARCAAQLAAYERRFWSVRITDQAIRQYYVRMSNDLVRAQQIDTLAKTNAQKAYERLQKGEKWNAVAAACSEDKLVNKNLEKYAQEWFAVGDDAMGMSELAVQLPKMKPGDYTKPFEARDGMLIVRLTGRNGKLYKLSRMLFRMAQPVVISQDAETVRKQLAANAANARRQETLKRVRAAARFEYPMGTNFVYKIWPEEKN